MTHIQIAQYAVYTMLYLAALFIVVAIIVDWPTQSANARPLIHHHDWTKWEKSDTIMHKNCWQDDAHYIPYYDTQRRKCNTCGKEQIRREYY